MTDRTTMTVRKDQLDQMDVAAQSLFGTTDVKRRTVLDRLIEEHPEVNISANADELDSDEDGSDGGGNGDTLDLDSDRDISLNGDENGLVNELVGDDEYGDMTVDVMTDVVAEDDRFDVNETTIEDLVYSYHSRTE